MTSGGEALIRALADENVDIIFGYPGGAALHIYDAIYQQDRVQHILVRHEQAATHAADGFARATGKPGVCLVTSGPGATNAITGIATAYMDSIPLVVISGQVPNHLIGTDAFQETDMMGISRPIVKHSFLVHKKTMFNNGSGNTHHIGFLKSIGTYQMIWYLARNNNQRNGIHVGSRDTSNRISSSWSRSNQTNSRFSSGPSKAISCVRCSLFVPY